MLEPEVLRLGDSSGNRMLVRYAAPSGAKVYGIGVPQAWKTPLGPTWCYVVEGDDLIVVDPGCHGSVQFLEEGLAAIGYSISAVDRIVVTHGHMDHDGNCLTVVQESGAQLWAHEIYGTLLTADRWEREMEWRREISGFEAFENTEVVDRVKDHHRRSQHLNVDVAVTDGFAADGLTFYHTPGHSPDELCIQFDQFMFSGDHVLPQITPHPSVCRSYSSFQTTLPDSYSTSNEVYGLKALLRSLKRVATLGDDVGVLPAHRAYHRSKFNLIGLERAGEIVDHHRQRCHDLIDLLRRGPADLPSLTRDHFSHRELEDSNFFLALNEVMSHVELLEETGDVSVTGQSAARESGACSSGGQIRWNGTEAFDGFIENLEP